MKRYMLESGHIGSNKHKTFYINEIQNKKFFKILFGYI